MRVAVVEKPKAPIVVREVEKPLIGPHDVLIRVEACGVCGSDLHLAFGDWTWELIKFPLIPGHEVAGVVEAVGAEVGHVSPGTRVGMPWLFSACGHCRECLRGEEILCHGQEGTGVSVPGGYAEYLRAPADFVTEIPPAFSSVEAAPLFCAGVTVYTGLTNAGVRPGQRVAVLGIGGLGHLAVLFAAAMGLEVVAISRSDEKLRLAERLGAQHAINQGVRPVGDALRDFGGVDLVLAPTIATEVMGQVLDGLAPDGTLVVLGAAPGTFAVSPEVLVAGRRRILGSPAGSRKDLRDCLAFASRHSIRPMVETYPLAEVGRVFARVQQGLVRFRAVLTLR